MCLLECKSTEFDKNLEEAKFEFEFEFYKVNRSMRDKYKCLDRFEHVDRVESLRSNRFVRFHRVTIDCTANIGKLLTKIRMSTHRYNRSH